MGAVLALTLISWMTTANARLATPSLITVFNALNNPALLARQNTMYKIMHVPFAVIYLIPAVNAKMKQLVPNV
jgi:hypothetical protein